MEFIMNYLNNILKYMKENPTPFIIFGVIVFIAIVYGILLVITQKNNAKKFLEENKDAAKITFNNKSNLIYHGFLKADFEKDVKCMGFHGFTSRGYYVVPGKYVIDVQYTASRSGILYRTVTKTWGPFKSEITVEANKEYVLSFNRKTESVEFEEVNRK